MALEIVKTYNELISDARHCESSGDLEKAALSYERAIRQEPHAELPYNRLMILYRKLHRYEDELRVIEKGIESFQKLYRKKSQKLLGKNAAAEKLSKSLARSLGLTDTKGNELQPLQPIEEWQKRKSVVEKKLGRTIEKKSNKPATNKRKSAAVKKAAKKKPTTAKAKATKTANRRSKQ